MSSSLAETTPVVQVAHPPFIALEGLDGCGKSTVGRLLAERLGCRLVHTPPAFLHGVRSRVEAHMTGHARRLFYASTVVWASEEARAETAAGNGLVVVRYWLSTLAYGEVEGDTPPGMGLLEASLMVPDLTVFIDAPASVRATRLASRGPLSPHDEMSLARAGELEAAYMTHARRFLPDGAFLRVDGRRPPEDVVARIMEVFG